MGKNSNGSTKLIKEKTQNTKSSKRKNGLQNGNCLTDNISAYIYHRLFGYSIAAAVHVINVLAMALALRGPVMKDPDIQHFYSMEFFYITIWNLVFQLLYIGMGFACDLPVLLRMKYSKFLTWLRWYRRIYYNGVLWPCGIIIFSVFWPVYAYDRNLIFPDYIDKVLSQASNYIIHMFIIFPIIWDLFYLPNQKPSSQKCIFVHCAGIFVIYLIALFELYGQRGIWPYPVLKLLYGSLYFPLVFVVLAVLLTFIYLLQWPLISYVWRK